MHKSDLAKGGDPIKFQTNVAMKDGYNYQIGNIYDGHIVSHSTDQATTVEFVGDDGSPVVTTLYYDSYSIGMESFELLISDDELELRKNAWLEKEIEIAKENSDAALTKLINHLKSVHAAIK